MGTASKGIGKIKGGTTGIEPFGIGPFGNAVDTTAINNASGVATRDIDAFRNALGLQNPQFSEIGQLLINRGLGTEQDPLIAMQRQRALEGSRGRLTRQGVGGSVLENQLARQSAGFDEAALAQRESNLRGGFELVGAGLQNQAGVAGLSIAQLAALTAGQQGGGRGK